MASRKRLTQDSNEQAGAHARAPARRDEHAQGPSRGNARLVRRAQPDPKNCPDLVGLGTGGGWIRCSPRATSGGAPKNELQPRAPAFTLAQAGAPRAPHISLAQYAAIRLILNSSVMAESNASGRETQLIARFYLPTVTAQRHHRGHRSQIRQPPRPGWHLQERCVDIPGRGDRRRCAWRCRKG